MIFSFLGNFQKYRKSEVFKILNGNRGQYRYRWIELLKRNNFCLKQNLISLGNDPKYIIMIHKIHKIKDVQSACHLDKDIFPFFVSRVFRRLSTLLQDLKNGKLHEFAVSYFL